jgi:DNA repair protein RecN (Recombination protein N)
MSALTGETGAGKTMIVDALSLLLGSKPDPSRVRPGATEAVVEGLFVSGDAEVVIRRVVPAQGRSRSYVNGELATAAQLAELGHDLIEITGQHAHQRLSAPATQRRFLDQVAEVPLEALTAAREAEREVRRQLDALGGDERSRAREADLLRYQLGELDAAAVTDPDEDERLTAEEDLLAGALEYRRAAATAVESLAGDSGAVDTLRRVVADLSGAPVLAAEVDRLMSLTEELADVCSDLRGAEDRLEEDPERLDAIRKRRHLLVELRRKYGESLADVIAFTVEARDRLAELDSHQERAEALERELERCAGQVRREARTVAELRRAGAAVLEAAVTDRLADVAMSGARFEVTVEGDDPADDVAFLLAANAGLRAAPLASGASGGELSRSMLALYLVATTDVDTTVFDEIDAGVGGQAAVAIGRALASLATRRQVIVVTHLPQVAAFADTQLAVSKSGDDITTSTVKALDSDERVIELSRMLSGSPDSGSARSHASELLELASTARSSS